MIKEKKKQAEGEDSNSMEQDKVKNSLERGVDAGEDFEEEEESDNWIF